MRISTLLFATLVASQLGIGECDPGENLITDPGFDLWCGTSTDSDSLCAWDVERGSVTQAPTWDAADWGLEFVGSDVAIDQSAAVTSSDVCEVDISVLADVDDDAEVDLNIYVNAGTPYETLDFTQRLWSASWALETAVYSPEGDWNGLRIELAKTGSGHAELARLQGTAYGCSEW